MKIKYFLFFVAMNFLFFEGCKNNITNQIDNEDNYNFYEGVTYFNGITNSTAWIGGGVAFIEEDSSLHFRGIYGELLNHKQIDIEINKFESGPSIIDSGKAILSVVVGGDAVEKTYISMGNQADSISYNWNKKEGYISGQFNFKGQFSFNGLINDSSIILISGNFKIQAAKSGTKWGMNYDKDGNITCSFTN